MKKSRINVKKPTVVIKHLSKTRKLPRVLGYAYCEDGVIEIDPKQTGKQFCNTLIHECSHIILPDASEKDITKIANMITDILWQYNFRRMMK